MGLAKHVSKNVKSMRLVRGLSQQDLADKTGLAVRYISRLENTSPNITLDVLERLLDGLECSIIELVGDENESLPKTSIKALDETIRVLQGLRSRF